MGDPLPGSHVHGIRRVSQPLSMVLKLFKQQTRLQSRLQSRQTNFDGHHMYQKPTAQIKEI